MTNKTSWAGLLAIAVKIGPKFLSIGFKFLKAGKVVQVGSAVASVGAWSLVFSWQFALLIMLLLVVHESGHVWAMKRVGMKTKGIFFIPFLGAAAVSEEMFPSRRDEMYVAIMGPVWGLALSGVALGGWYIFDLPHFAAAAAWMATVNLFNLLPISPLDGGRIFKSIAFSIYSWLGLIVLALGLVAALGLVVFAHLWLFVILFFIGLFELGYEWWRMKRYRELKETMEGVIRDMGVSPDDLRSVIPETMPSMNRYGILWSAAVYGIAAGVLYAIIRIGSSVSGAGNPIQLFS